jgi:hypothetical protein
MSDRPPRKSNRRISITWQRAEAERLEEAADRAERAGDPALAARLWAEARQERASAEILDDAGRAS